MHRQRLVEFPFDEGRLFYCLEELPQVSPNDSAVIFLHGLGENRAGLNYIFSEIGEGLRRVGYSTYRFDLGGCGESTLPLSVSIWKKQLETVLAFAQFYKKIHIIARGVSSVLLTEEHSHSVAVGPITKQQVIKQLSTLAVDEEEWIISKQEDKKFWYSMGLEAGCLFWGPFHTLVKELQELDHPLPEKCRVIYGGHFEGTFPSSAYCLSECHPLFLYQADRQILLNELIEVLND